MYSSNAFWAKSGYGIQGASLLPRLAELPQFNGRENIAQFAWYGLQGGLHNVDGFTIYPAGMDPYGNDIIGSHVKHFKADVLITLIDAWVLQDITKKIEPALWLPWLPIDHHDAPPRVLDAIKDAHLPITYSKFGQKCLEQHGINNIYIPHGIETDVYKVFDASEFKRDVMGIDGHLTIMVAANKGRNPDRKAFQWQLRAWAEFSRNKPDAWLYIHTEPTPMFGGYDLVMLTQMLGINDKVKFPDRYENFIGLPAQYLANVYNSANVMLAASMGEGFCIPLIEAQACGTPVITNNFTAMPELVRYGDILEPKDYQLTELDAFMCIPDVDAIVDSLENNYQQWLDNIKEKDTDTGIKAQDSIHAEFSWDTLVEQYWQPLFTDLDTTKQKKVEPKQKKVEPKKKYQVKP